jgi:hypothetical protein
MNKDSILNVDMSGKPPRHPKATPLKYSSGIAFGPNKRTRRGALRTNNANKLKKNFGSTSRSNSRSHSGSSTRSGSQNPNNTRKKNQSLFQNTRQHTVNSGYHGTSSRPQLNINKLQGIINRGEINSKMDELTAEEMDWILQHMQNA